MTKTLQRATWEELEMLFQGGKPPKDLQGFYRGRLLATRINPLTNFVMTILKKRLMPWKGKTFDSKKRKGVNIVSRKASFLFRFQNLPSNTKPNGKTLEVFPFKIRQGRSLTSKKNRVYIIDYDTPKNPPGVRKIVDELVKVGDNLYLGKAQLAFSKNAKTVAYFYLQK